jgi:hypothetical protein
MLPPPKTLPKKNEKEMCEAWVTRDPLLSACAAAILVCVTVVAYSAVLLFAMAVLVRCMVVGTMGTSRSWRSTV